MKPRDYRDYVADMVEAIGDIESFIKGMTYEDFIADKKTRNAVIRSVEVIGEAAAKLPDEIRSKEPQMPWARIVGMRNRLVHEYFGIDNQILWKTVSESIPELNNEVKRLLDALK